MLVAQAQTSIYIRSGGKVYARGGVKVNMGASSVTNNGDYTDYTGTLNAYRSFTYGGVGTTRLNLLNISTASGTTVFNSLVSVYNNAKIAAGNVNANNNIYLRSDAGNATMINNGALTNSVRGLITKASVTTGSCPSYTSVLSLNISGSSMVYQWQSSPDSASWTNVAGATASAYTATVTGVTYYRCSLTTNNSSFAQATPGVKLNFVSSSPAAITGSATVCSGGATTLSNATPGGVWSSGAPAVATIGSTGIVTGVNAGTTTITYSLSCGAPATMVVTVLPAANAGVLSGAGSVCLGNTVIYSSTVSGGVWSASNSNVALLDSAVTGVAAGTSVISYAVSNSCGTAIATRSLTINSTPDAGTVTGPSSVCAGATIGLASTVGGGVWSASNANVSVAGSAITGVTAGVSVVSYTVSYSCGAATATTTITINAAPVAGSLSGASSVCVGNTIVFTPSIGGGAWSASNSNVTITDSAVTGVAVGASVISYTVTNGCGAATATAAVNINDAPSAGVISGPSSVSVGSTITLSPSVSGGAWSSSDPTIASVSAGVVTGRSSGSVYISYTVTNSCGAATATALLSVSAPALPGITGDSTVCEGATALQSNSVTAGVWSSDNTGIATIGSASGMVTGIASGTTTISYTVLGSSITRVITVSAAPSAIGGSTTVCAGGSGILTSSPTGGTWISGNSARATVGSTSGMVTGIVAGTAPVTYTVGGCRTISSVSVSASPSAISGLATVCQGATTNLSGPTGGAWSSSDNSIATISGLGVVSGVSAGAVTITYTVGAGCSSLWSMTVNAVSAITGASGVCVGQTTTLGNATPGGVWSSGNSTIAAVGSASGIVSGVATGATTISYTTGAGCRVTRSMAVGSLGALSGAASVCQGQTTTLTNTTSGGIWSSSDNSIATVGSATGVVTGIAGGGATISYTTGGGCVGTKTIAVTALGAITGGTSVCRGQTLALSNTATGGVWTSSNALTAAVGSLSGIVTGNATGSVTISYTLGGCRTTQTIAVSASSPITGTTSLYEGQVVSLSATGAGTWSSSAPAIASIGSATGSLTAVAAGSAIITFSLTAGCASTTTVGIVPVAAITPPTSSACVGQSVTLTASIPGGTWSTNNTLIARIGSATGILDGINAGAVLVYYTLPTGARTTFSYTINRLTAITGAATVCAGQSIALINPDCCGAWTSFGAAASVGYSTGIVTGTSAGTSIITYTLPTGCATTKTITVQPFSAIAGPSSVCAGQTITLTNATGGGTWSSNNPTRAAIGSTTGIVTGIVAGSVAISYTISSTGCRATYNVAVSNCRIGAGETEDGTAIAIIPNPNGGDFRLAGNIAANSEVANITITNMVGQVVERTTAAIEHGRIERQIHLSENLANGMYLLTISAGETHTVLHFVVGK